MSWKPNTTCYYRVSGTITTKNSTDTGAFQAVLATNGLSVYAVYSFPRLNVNHSGYSTGGDSVSDDVESRTRSFDFILQLINNTTYYILFQTSDETNNTVKYCHVKIQKI
jgi:hypothetical protein